jgi:hypothetical protein
MEIQEPEASEALASQPVAMQRRDDLQLSLDCPQCGAGGWVRLASLQRGMTCPKCNCHFHVARNGQLRSDDKLPRVRFHCPRCHQAGSIPAAFKIRKAKCGACKLPLEIGPDEQLHGAKEAAKLRRATAVIAARDSSIASSRLGTCLQKFFFLADGKMRTTNVVLVSIFALGLLAAVVAGAGSFFLNSPEGSVREFTYKCLAGDWHAAESFLPPNDDVALVEFQRWRGFYFTSILDKHRPTGDSVRVLIERKGNGTGTDVFVVTMTSSVIGKRIIREHWHEQDGKWEFDVVATLAAMHGG